MLEGRSTSYGELLEGDKRQIHDNNPDAWLNNLPQGAPVPPGKTSLDVITEAIVGIKQSQLFEIVYDMKVSNAPKHLGGQ
jgi:cleavage stimulation factor subunit 2